MSAPPPAVLVGLAIVVGAVALCRVYAWLYRALLLPRGTSPSIGFFHPYCHAGGGGERVLWCAVRSIQQSAPERKRTVIVYTGDLPLGIRPSQFITRAKQRFGIEIEPENLRFVPLRLRFLTEARLYPRFTLVLQSLGAVLVALEALLRAPAHVFFDSAGYAFTYPLARFAFGCRVACYTHYPTISRDMLQRVLERRPQYNNDEAIAQSLVLSRAKLLYYRVFAWAYGMVGCAAQRIFVNSSWTKGHVAEIFGRRDVRVIFPPCDTEQLQKLPLHPRQKIVMSVAQFRPEKDHALQLHAFADFRKRYPKESDGWKLHLCGGVRDARDEALLAALKKEAARLGVEGHVSFLVNVPWVQLQRLMSHASVGLHTMWNEHFGIGVVEMQAAGLVVIAHKSGGPLMDIVGSGEHGRDGTSMGFLASSPATYADELARATAVAEGPARSAELDAMRKRARRGASRFSDQVFAEAFLAAGGEEGRGAPLW